MPSKLSPATERCDRIAGSAVPKSNPFATKFIRAGAISYRFPDGDSLHCLRTRLAESHWRGQIVGPHGSGKSTLLATLDAHWRVWGRTPKTVCLHNRQRTLPTKVWDDIYDRVADTIIIDGFEQLGVICKWRLLLTSVTCNVGLIVTVHRQPPAWQSRLLPAIFTTHTSLESTHKIATQLLNAQPAITNANKQSVLSNLPRHFAHHDGNVRETFLSLYDDVAY